MRRLVALVARFVVALLFRRFEVAGAERLPRGRPVLLVANHFNGFVDPVVIAAALGRLPRFVAKDELRRIPIAGRVLRLAGVVFVRRRDPGAAAAAGNEDAFAECHAALVDRDVVAIFPEGTTHDRPHMDPLRTGAARIALGARAAGADELVVVPVGLTFPDKIPLRSAGLVLVGDPIAVDDVVPAGAGADDTDAVRRLTTTIDEALRAVIQDFPDVEAALTLEGAAEVALRDADLPEPSLAARHALARRLGRATPEARAHVAGELGRYATVLRGLRITDDDLVHPTSPRRLVRSAVAIAALVVVLGSVVAATALVNVWPALLVGLASMAVTTPVTKGTVRVLVGLIAFPAAWITAGVLTADGPLRISLVVVTAAVGALAAVWLIERALALGLLVLRWRAQIERTASASVALDVRHDVVAAVRDAVREVPA
ncbi:1-acyl-sn-glycerol-3-phosphate acyltransferase [Actinomarinicola tropica]|uniref:Phospholipid/glycerol acyltransferase domain-containing protein n=1 Tax=Actinomarinicola tropica TaxID=2789776 RepID=A0A5Q2RFN9_9ACTN|nr:1-acyl-sn-glycerol-3-phosphate acyltransferase [Actinomarinicola tropica]QGG94464.1 hypothetical protein GH723_04735 [Actinomarinicola tropica]